MFAKLIWIISFSILVVSCSQEINPTHQAMKVEKIKCPPGSQIEINRWGKSGWSQSCKLKHGKFTGWENGKKIYEVNYEYGKEVGDAYWYNESGDITKTIKYVDGKVVSEITNNN